MKTIKEISRRSAPASLPQSLAWDGTSLWIGSIANQCIYELDTANWSVKSEFKAPGNPFGMVSVGSELRVLCGETEEDIRNIRRLEASTGFDSAFKLPCPDDTGSQLSFDGGTLYVSQWYNQRILALNADGGVEKSYNSPRGICAQTIVGNSIYLINTADEDTNEYYLGRINRSSGEYEELATVPFPARALAHDGERFWTNHRAAGETVSFEI